jgi:hypothetical protein
MKTKLTAVVSIMAVSLLALMFASPAMAQRAGGGYESSTKKPAAGTTPSGASQGPVQGSGSANVGKAITPEEAQKKYPPPKGGYPMGERDPHKPSGIVDSPYPPRTEFDCSQIPKGGLVLDTRANKVFVRP